MKRRKQKGYTLIELLLVVTVIAFIAALGVKTYREKAALGPNQYCRTEYPTCFRIRQCLTTSPNQDFGRKKIGIPARPQYSQDFVLNYLPNESNQSNFGTALCWNGDDPNDPKKTQQGKRFWVALDIGSDATAVKSAQRIAARLPNAIITNTPDTECSADQNNNCNTCDGSTECYVKAAVSIPSVVSQNNAYVAGAGYCDPTKSTSDSQGGSGTGVSCQRMTIKDQFPNNSITNPAAPSIFQYLISFQCKPGEIPQIYATPGFVTMDRYPGGDKSNTYIVEPMYSLSVVPAQDPDATDLCINTSPTPSNGVVSCKLTLHGAYDAQNGEGIDDVGCTDSMQTDGICKCPYQSTNVKHCPNNLGSIGASYIAICNPPNSFKVAESRQNDVKF